jgi:hypothetical protein
MEPEGLLPRSQELSTCPYPEPDQSTPFPHSISPRSILISSTHPRLDLPRRLFPTNNLRFFSAIRVTCSAHLILLEVIILIILGEEYKLRSSSLCSFLHPSATSSLLGPNILLSTLSSNTLSQRPSFTPIQNHRQNYRLVHFCFSTADAKTGGSGVNGSKHDQTGDIVYCYLSFQSINQLNGLIRTNMWQLIYNATKEETKRYKAFSTINSETACLLLFSWSDHLLVSYGLNAR